MGAYCLRSQGCHRDNAEPYNTSEMIHCCADTVHDICHNAHRMNLNLALLYSLNWETNHSVWNGPVCYQNTDSSITVPLIQYSASRSFNQFRCGPNVMIYLVVFQIYCWFMCRVTVLRDHISFYTGGFHGEVEYSRWYRGGLLFNELQSITGQLMDSGQQTCLYWTLGHRRMLPILPSRKHFSPEILYTQQSI